MVKNIEDIIISRERDSEKLEVLKQYEEDIKTAKDIINGKLTYCEECKDYYLTKSFFSEKETIPTKICMYEDPINSGGNDYVDGYADILYSVCPKGHKHVVDRREKKIREYIDRGENVIQVIETNLSIDKDDTIRDHQSRIVEVEDWDTYCKAFEKYNGEAVYFKSKTMPGNSILSNCTMTDLIYDDIHLSCMILHQSGFITKKLAYRIVL